MPTCEEKMRVMIVIKKSNNDRSQNWVLFHISKREKRKN